MKPKFSHFIGIHGFVAASVFFALWGCSGGGGGLQQLDAAAPGLDVPATTQNNFGPAERPAISSSSDPQEGIDLAELKESCQPFLDADDKDGAPQKCQDYWENLKNYGLTAPTICIVGTDCPSSGNLHQIEPATVVTQPVLQQIVIPHQGSEEITYQAIQPYHFRELPEGVLRYNPDDDADD